MMTTNDRHAFFERGWNRHDVDRLMTFAGDKIARKSAVFKTRTA
jgi:hypothetical protein